MCPSFSTVKVNGQSERDVASLTLTQAGLLPADGLPVLGNSPPVTLKVQNPNRCLTHLLKISSGDAMGEFFKKGKKKGKSEKKFDPQFNTLCWLVANEICFGRR